MQTNTVEGAITEITKIKHSRSVLFLAVVCIDSGREWGLSNVGFEYITKLVFICF